jgi:LCP family protein required for cell wall assembly
MFEHLDDNQPFVPDDRFRTEVHRRGDRRRTRRRVATGILSSLTAVFVLVGAVAVAAGRTTAGISRVDMGSVPQVDEHGNPAAPNLDRFDQPFTALVVGTDGGAALPGDQPGPAWADTILLVRVDVPAGKVRIASVPRDLWVPIAGTGDGRINTALAQGREALIRTVNTTFGVTVDHYAEIDFAGFTKLVDAVDGVPVTFPTATRDLHSGLRFDAGCHVLDGTQALALARSRYYDVQLEGGSWMMDPTYDLGRAARQRLLVDALVRRLATRGGVDTLQGLVGLLQETVALDTNLGTGDLVALAWWSRSLAPDAVTGMTPWVRPATRDRGAVLELLPGADTELRTFLDTGMAPAPVTPEPPGDDAPRAPDAAAILPTFPPACS